MYSAAVVTGRVKETAGYQDTGEGFQHFRMPNDRYLFRIRSQKECKSVRQPADDWPTVG
jgi:hypothetical protein